MQQKTYSVHLRLHRPQGEMILHSTARLTQKQYTENTTNLTPCCLIKMRALHNTIPVLFSLHATQSGGTMIAIEHFDYTQ